MAKQATATAEKPGVVSRIQEFYHEVRAEMRKVSWPTKEDVKSSTQIVLFLLVAISAIMYVYDLIFSRIIIFLLNILT